MPKRMKNSCLEKENNDLKAEMASQKGSIDKLNDKLKELEIRIELQEKIVNNATKSKDQFNDVLEKPHGTKYFKTGRSHLTVNLVPTTSKILLLDQQNIKCNDCEFKCHREVDLPLHMSVKHQANSEPKPAYSSEYLT